MSSGAKVDLYNNAYAHYAEKIYSEIRLATYGEDFGQTSWATTDESHAIPEILGLRPESRVLEIGCGSGRYALYVAESVRCEVLGLDINAAGIANCRQLAEERKLAVRFECCDVSKGLPAETGSFDAVFSTDVLCHIPNRAALLGEIHRVLEPGGRLLFSDALIIGGAISQEEIAIRSSIGYYLFSPPGENERLIRQAGFRLLKAEDTTKNARDIAERWFAAREARKDDLAKIEGEANFAGLQRFLACALRLTSERRLLRRLYVARKLRRRTGHGKSTQDGEIS
jgi:SAM-dependent methyltransferase